VPRKGGASIAKNALHAAHILLTLMGDWIIVATVYLKTQFSKLRYCRQYCKKTEEKHKCLEIKFATCSTGNYAQITLLNIYFMRQVTL